MWGIYMHSQTPTSCWTTFVRDLNWQLQFELLPYLVKQASCRPQVFEMFNFHSVWEKVPDIKASSSTLFCVAFFILPLTIDCTGPTTKAVTGVHFYKNVWQFASLATRRFSRLRLWLRKVERLQQMAWDDWSFTLINSWYLDINSSDIVLAQEIGHFRPFEQPSQCGLVHIKNVSLSGRLDPLKSRWITWIHDLWK